MSIEAMKQALEALETCTPADFSTSYVIYPWHDEKMVNEAITSLRQAIAEAKKQKPICKLFGTLPIYDKPQHQKAEKQEPVEMVVLRDGLPTLLRDRDIKLTDKRLYTSPPQRQPLTEWQPIETAPKNSTSILIYCPRSERKPVCEAWWAIAYEGDHGGHWQTPIGPNGRGYIILETAPTHWMPLPTPPIEAAHGIKEEA